MIACIDHDTRVRDVLYMRVIPFKMRVVAFSVALFLLLGLFVLVVSAKKGPLVTDKVS